MVALHVVVVAGGTDWHTAISFWLLVAMIGGSFASLANEARDANALACDLSLAAAGGALLNLASQPLGTDPLAGVYGVRVFWTTAGALIVLSLAHEGTRLLPRFGLTAPIGAQGGPTQLLLWLSGWPSERGLIEATYADGMPLKLLPASLHYQTRGGPLPAARAVAIQRIARARAESDDLVLLFAANTADGRVRELRLTEVRPCGQATAFADRLLRLVATHA